MEPPWIKYPQIGLGSIGWRMGYGEDYWFAFADWYNGLDAAGKTAVRERYPEPAVVKKVIRGPVSTTGWRNTNG